MNVLEVSALRNKFGACLLLLLSIAVFAYAAEARDIYVRLADGPSSISVTSDGALTLIDGSQKSHGLGKSAVLARSGAAVVVGKSKYALPVRLSSGGLLGFNGRKYRGELLITREFVVINVLDVEDYIRGVLPVEASAKWPREYLKVQAIISRTYGVRQSLNRSARGYDVVDSVSDQVYRGAGVETPTTDQAVRESEGEVLTYGNELAFTPFHSDSGGYTATNAHVWGKNLPYLTGVREPVAYRSPHSGWVAKIPASQIRSALAKTGNDIGEIREIRVAEIDSGGRAVSFTFIGSAGSRSVKSSLFRTAVGANLLKSTMLTGEAPMVDQSVEVDTSAPAEVQESTWSPEVSEESDSQPKTPVPTSNTPMSGAEELRLTRMTSDGVFTSTELMDMLMNPEKRKGYLYVGMQRGSAPKKTVAQQPLPKSLPGTSMPALRSGQVISEENGFFVFRGRGWGHGVGLSQWGAQALAGDGWSAERILEHYYPGTAVKRFK